ncbi:MAG: acetate--CoA ligase family protein [Pseudomonadota bacterium]
MADLGRFLNPGSIAVYGGSWAANVIRQLQKTRYAGEIWPVHPNREEVCGIKCFASSAELPAAPDAAFIGVNRERSIGVVEELKSMNAGGAICFASGFKELSAGADGADLQTSLLAAAGDMPLLGPNCYGFLNYADNVCIWPDQHGGQTVADGAAIIAQSSNIAINMTMQRRGLALTHLVTVGNQAQIDVAQVAMALLEDSRVKAIGLYLEGFGDIRNFEKMAQQARAVGKPIVALKIGKSRKARAATVTHTASLAGSAAASSALLKRLGIVEVDSVTVFLETLKLLDKVGPLASSHIASVSCSGGEASLMADLSEGLNMDYPDLSQQQQTQLRAVLGDRVDLANPLDYHTYIWGDVPTMTACFNAVMQGSYALNVFVLDIPRSDTCDPAGHDCAIEAIISAKQATGAPVAVIDLLPENLEEETTRRFANSGVITLHGMETGLQAIDAIIRSGQLLALMPDDTPVLLQQQSAGGSKGEEQAAITIDEEAAKSQLAECGLPVPRSARFPDKAAIKQYDQSLRFPLVLKGLGLAHKTEAGAVVLGLKSAEELQAAVANMPDCRDGYLLEEMVADVIAEVLIGVTVDATGLVLLTVGAGGILTETLGDSVSILLPARRQDIEDALGKLKLARILNGYRGQPAADWPALLDAIEAVARYAEQHRDTLLELDINPLMVGAKQAVAVDALIRSRS